MSNPVLLFTCRLIRCGFELKCGFAVLSFFLNLVCYGKTFLTLNHKKIVFPKLEEYKIIIFLYAHEMSGF